MHELAEPISDAHEIGCRIASFERKGRKGSELPPVSSREFLHAPVASRFKISEGYR